MDNIKGSSKALIGGAGALLAMLSQTLDTFGFIVPDVVEKPLGLVIAGATMILAWFAPYKPSAPKTS